MLPSLTAYDAVRRLFCNPHTVQRILRHLRKNARDPRSVYTGGFRGGSRAPP